MFEKYLKFYDDFPIKGIKFVDVMPLLSDKEVFRAVTTELSNLVDAPNLAAPEARGFLFGAPLLYKKKSPVENMIVLRKRNKLPFAGDDMVIVPIMKEYGEDNICYRKSDIAAGKLENGVFEICLFDDVLATGGTALGIANSLNSQKIVMDGKEYPVHVSSFLFLVELDDLKGKERLESIAPVRSICHI